MCPAPLLPLAAEDHVCADCDLRYEDLTVESALGLVEGVPKRARRLTTGVARTALRARPEPDSWSAMEYVAHLRDVFATYTIRLHRSRTEDRPVLEPMLNDLRARRFGYNDLPLGGVLDELAANVVGFGDEAARAKDWTRPVVRLPGEERTALWLLRQAAHEGAHHLADIAAALPAAGPRGLEFREARIDGGDGARLATAMTTEISELYGGMDLGAADMPKAGPAELGPPDGVFLVGYDAGRPVACGGVKRLPDGACEIKRMYVAPQVRGQGLARVLLHALEDAARRRGYEVVRLDTGPLNHTAQALYTAEGYRQVPNFNGNPVATYFGEKRL